MTIKNRYLCYILFLSFLSCKYTEKKTIEGKDTSAIFQEIFNSKSFIKKNICVASDSLYFLKTKYFNNSWPKKNKYFNVFFIEDIPQSKILNFGPNSPSDERTRISVLKFTLKKDTVSILMLDHGPNIFWQYNLVKNNNNWLVVKEHSETGGRRVYYGFEKDKWYLDLKKKIKSVKPMFPPPEPKD